MLDEGCDQTTNTLSIWLTNQKKKFYNQRLLRSICSITL